MWRALCRIVVRVSQIYAARAVILGSARHKFMKRAPQFYEACATLIWSERPNSRKRPPQFWGTAPQLSESNVLTNCFLWIQRIAFDCWGNDVTREKMIFFLQDLFARQAERICRSPHNRFCQRRVWRLWCFVVYIFINVRALHTMHMFESHQSLHQEQHKSKKINKLEKYARYLFWCFFFQLSVMHFNYLARIIIFANYNHLFMLRVKLE